jgi:hypothetical protein
MSNYFENTDKIDQWFKKRRAKFSSSEQWKLLPTSKQPANQLWSGTASTHIETKVIELSTKIYERPDLDEAEALRHGKINEYPAFERYIQETKNYSMSYLGDENPTFIPCKDMPDESGGTPDVANIVQGINELVTIDYGAEIKNAYNPAYHFRRLKWRSMWDVKQGYPSCYAQIQDLIRITGAFGWDFISYDERQLSKKSQIVIIEVKPDRKFIDNLELRIQLAVKEKYKVLSDHMGVELKNRNDYLNFING